MRRWSCRYSVHLKDSATRPPALQAERVPFRARGWWQARCGIEGLHGGGGRLSILVGSPDVLVRGAWVNNLSEGVIGKWDINGMVGC